MSNKPQTNTAILWAKLSLAAVLLFLVLLTSLHFIEPEYEPSRHLISEYELGDYGWLMSVVFVSLAISVAAMVISTWAFTRGRGGIIGRCFFIPISIALVGASIFYPYLIHNTASNIHNLCGVIVIFTFPIAATLYSKQLARSNAWADSRKLLSLAMWAVWFGFLVFFVSLIVFHPANDEDKKSLVVGWQNRFMMLTYCLWLITIAYSTIAIQRKEHQAIV